MKLFRKLHSPGYYEFGSSAINASHVIIFVWSQASSPAVAAPQYRPQSVAYVAPQYAQYAQYAPAAAPPQYVAKPAAAAGLAYAGQHRLAGPAKGKASAIGYAQQRTASSPILYQAYQP